MNLECEKTALLMNRTSRADWMSFRLPSSPPTIPLTSPTTWSGAPAKGLKLIVRAVTSWILLLAKLFTSFMASISQKFARAKLTPAYAKLHSAADKKCWRTTRQTNTMDRLLRRAYLYTSGRTTAKLTSDAVSCLRRLGKQRRNNSTEVYTHSQLKDESDSKTIIGGAHNNKV